MAEEQFAAVRRQAERAQTEHEVALQERAEHIAKLRALRLAKRSAWPKRRPTGKPPRTASQ
jgi:hypothetical protein